MINGAWVSVDQPTRGSSLSFTYARSGALMARIGAHGQSSQALNNNPNSPINDYFSALDFVSTSLSQCSSTVITPAMAQTGILNSYTTVQSGRLYLAQFRWNFFPQLANGSITILVDYTSPLQLAVSSSAIQGTAAGALQHPVVLTQSVGSSIPTSVQLATQNLSSVSVSGLLPVVNITGLQLNPSISSVSPYQNASEFTFSGRVNQVSQGGAVAQNGAPGPWLSAYQQPAVRLTNQFTASLGQVGIDMSPLLSSNQFGFLFPASRSSMPLNPYLQQYYPPCSPDYDCEYDSGINVMEGGTITFTVPTSDTWCFPMDWSNAPSVCSNAQGATQLPYLWNGCSGQYQGIFSTAALFGWNDTNSAYDNSGCNSDSILMAPVGAAVFRIGVDTTGMRHAGYIPVESHSFDYYQIAPASAQTVGGVFVYSFTAPNTGRLYLAYQGPGGNQLLFNGTIHVSATYQPPAGLVLGATWSPSPLAVQQPYLFPAPTQNTPAALQAAGLLPASNPTVLPLPDSFASVTALQVTFWVYQEIFTSPVTPRAPPQTGYLCFLLYSLPGNVDYPWSEFPADAFPALTSLSPPSVADALCPRVL